MTYFDVESVKASVRRAGLNMGEFFALAQVNKSTWHRWINGETSPNVETLERVRAALERLPKGKKK